MHVCKGGAGVPPFRRLTTGFGGPRVERAQVGRFLQMTSTDTGRFYVCQAATEDSKSLNSRRARCLFRQRLISLGVRPSAVRLAT